MTLTLSQTGTSLTARFADAGEYVHWDGACQVTGHTANTFSIDADVSGMTASGNGTSMTMNAALASLSGSYTGPGGKFTFTARRTSRP